MKFALIALVVAVANAAKPELSANSPLGQNLMHHARRLDQAQAEEDEWEQTNNWVANYSIKFVSLSWRVAC